jgi:site-specific DNA-cytosine methylase
MLTGIDITVRSVFACDTKRASKKLVEAHCPAENWHEAVINRNNENVPEVDVYTFTPSCKPFSAMGGRQGTTVLDGKLIFFSLD